MTSRLKLLIISLACVLSLLPVLYVNDALDIAAMTLKDSPGVPVIELNVEDPCNSIIDVVMTVEVTPDRAYLDIQSSVVDPPTPCKGTPFALITTSNLHLRMHDGRVVERGFSTIARAGTLERTAGSSSSFAVPLAGERDSDAWYQFASSALNAGFGESALQVQLRARKSTCPKRGAAIQSGQASAANEYCAIPLRAMLQYANTEFDVAAALPPTYYLVTGPNVGRTKSANSYATTRLLWAERPTAPSSDIKGTLTGFEIHLVDRHSVALKQFVTVAGSAVFGTFISMLLTFRASSHLKTTRESTDQYGAAPREQAHPQTPPPNSPRQAQTSVQRQAIQQPPEAIASEAARPPTQVRSRLAMTPEKPEPKHESTHNLDASASETAQEPPTPLPASPSQPQGSGTQKAIDQSSKATASKSSRPRKRSRGRS